MHSAETRIFVEAEMAEAYTEVLLFALYFKKTNF